MRVLYIFVGISNTRWYTSMA